MRRLQTRRTVSLSAQRYEQLRIVAERRNVPMAALIDELVQTEATRLGVEEPSRIAAVARVHEAARQGEERRRFASGVTLF